MNGNLISTDNSFVFFFVPFFFFLEEIAFINYYNHPFEYCFCCSLLVRLLINGYVLLLFVCRTVRCTVYFRQSSCLTLSICLAAINYNRYSNDM